MIIIFLLFFFFFFFKQKTAYEMLRSLVGSEMCIRDRPRTRRRRRRFAMSTTMIDRHIESPAAWTRSTVALDEGRLVLGPECVREIEAVVDTLRANPLPVLALRPDDFELAHCRRAAARLKAMLGDGPGFAIVDRLPLDRLRREEAVAVFWLLSSLIARPVAQKWDGTMVYDVRDLCLLYTSDAADERS